MTDREKAIIMAYTGVCMLTGDKFQIFHKYAEDLMGRPIMTHEMGLFANEIKEKARADFVSLCAEQEQEPKTGHWIVHPKGIYAHLVCDRCLSNAPYDCQTNYCPNCGAKMQEVEE